MQDTSYMGQWQSVHIFDELKHYNCIITIFNPLDYNSMEEANEGLIELIKINNYDLFMTPHESNIIFIDTLLTIKKIGIPTLLICFDNLIIPFNHKDICKHFDLVWLTSKETEKMFIKWGANIIFNPYAANPFFFMPNHGEEIEKICFVGNPYGSRANMLGHLTENNINVSLFSKMNEKTGEINLPKQNIINYFYPGYNLLKFNIGRKIICGAIKQKYTKVNRLNLQSPYIEVLPQVDFNSLSQIYSNYVISLASVAARNTGVLKNPVNVVNLRSFEIPMCGGLQICSYVSELANYFEEDKEIVFYRSDEELVEKTKFYLKPEIRKIRMQMKTAARRRAENEHTWFSRFKIVFDYFNLKYK